MGTGGILPPYHQKTFSPSQRNETFPYTKSYTMMYKQRKNNQQPSGKALVRLVMLDYVCCQTSIYILSTSYSATGLTSLCYERSHLMVGFALICFQRLSAWNTATGRLPLARQPVHWRFPLPGPLVLRKTPLNSLAHIPDMDRTVSRRSEPSSRAALMGEQPNPWDRLQPQDATSRHRGAKPPRRCGLLGEISLLSLW